jgi:pantetheine-phosphate adenylyltransferase
MRVAVYPGSFDPITNGHLDIIKRSSKMFDKLVIGVLNNSSKTALFTADERVKMIQRVTKGIENVEIEAFNGLLIDFVHRVNSNIIVRGLRAVTDFEYELQLSLTNKVIAPDIDTVFLTTNLKYLYLSSSMVKEIALYNGDISEFVDDVTAIEVFNKLKQKKKN